MTDLMLFILIYLIGYAVFLILLIKSKKDTQGYISIGDLIIGCLIALFSWFGLIFALLLIGLYTLVEAKFWSVWILKIQTFLNRKL